MQIKITMNYHYIPMRTAKIKLVTTPNASKYVQKVDHTYIAGRKQKCTAALENNLAVSYTTKQAILFNPAVTFLGIYPKEIKTYVHTKVVHEFSLQLYL